MCFFKRQITEEVEPDYRDFTIDYLRGLTEKEYEKVIKIVEIYREADEKVKIVELGSKKAVKELQKEEKADEELDGELADLMEMSDEQ